MMLRYHNEHQFENIALWHHMHISLHILTKPRGVVIANNFQEYHTCSEKKQRRLKIIMAAQLVDYSCQSPSPRPALKPNRRLVTCAVTSWSNNMKCWSVREDVAAPCTVSVLELPASTMLNSHWKQNPLHASTLC